MRRICFPTWIAFLMVACKPVDIPPPCEGVECLNGGECRYGLCLCPDGFEGDSCEILMPPSGFGIETILISDYPTFQDGAPWDSALAAPGCWPDFILDISWPWSVTNSTEVMANQTGDHLVINNLNLTGLDEWQIHDPEDTISLQLWEVDGIDSLEQIQPPESLFSVHLIPGELLPLDSANLPAYSVVGDPNGIQARVTWRYDYDH